MASLSDDQLIEYVRELQPNAYGVTIYDLHEERTGELISFTAIYSAIDKLTAQGKLKTYYIEGGKERGGRPKLMAELA